MKKIILSLGVMGLIDSAGAQQAGATVLDNVSNIVGKSTTIVGSIAGLLMGITFLVFLFSIISFILKRRAGDDKGLQDAKNMLGWSVIAMFVMVAVWGLVVFISQTFGVAIGGQVARPDAIPVDKASMNGSPSGSLKNTGDACTSPSECKSGGCTALIGVIGGGKTCD